MKSTGSRHVLANCFFALLLSATMGAVSVMASDEDKIDFNRQIRPLLNQHCIACHGPDEGDRQADLRLDTFEGATDYAIVVGDADNSDVVDRMTTDDEDLRMPPADHAEALKAEEIDLIKRWINQGAQYQRHWSFADLTQPAVPAVAQTDTQAPIYNAIDSFIGRGVIEAGLKPSPSASPRTLVRRAALALTGLPPNAHDDQVQSAIEQYLSQPSQTHFGMLVDQLLQSPAYSEHWASMWLDLARYADTCGYSGDEKRDIWPWRDWLIRNLESNKSYKDLSTEMLAGDLLPNATIQQKLATAFHRNTLANNEGGTDDEEFRVVAVKDRLSTTLNAWMGLTVRCAECHSHKYDPISHQEYYQLLDFFNQTVDADNRDDRPKLEVPQSRSPELADKIEQEIAALQDQLDGQSKVWTTLRPIESTSRNGTNFEVQDDDSILATGPLPGMDEYAFTFEVPAGETVAAVRLEALPHVKHNGNVGRAPEGGFILSQIRFAQLEDAEGENEPEETILPFAKAANDFSQTNMHARNAIDAKVESGRRKGWAVNHPATGYRVRHEAIFELKSPLKTDAATKFKIYLLHDPPWKRLTLGCPRISVCSVGSAVAKYEKKKLDPIQRRLTILKEERDAPVRVPVMEERPPKLKRESFIMLRGNFRSKGETVSAEFPEAFAPQGDLPRNRLGVAQWIFADENPLTARVAVNRYWARLMGAGIVETEEDFGTQGTPPSHPELLDHLAVTFRGDGWDVRRLLKRIVMSATWQQSSVVTKETLAVDPRNRWLARGPRVRLSAEVVRDQALAVSGLLSHRRYGAPVYPPNPVKRVQNAFTGGTKWQESVGEDRYRRAIYTFFKRSAPHPLFETFDISSRDVCSMRRQTTNTPLQSFMTLNDVTFIEAARALAASMIAASAEPAQQIETGIEKAIYDNATDEQVAVLLRLYEGGLEKYAANIKAAAEITGTATKGFDAAGLNAQQRKQLTAHASMTVVANVILNLDNFLNN